MRVKWAAGTDIAQGLRMTAGDKFRLEDRACALRPVERRCK